MTHEDLGPFTLALKRTGEAFGKAVSDDLAALYFRDLEEYMLLSVTRALDRARQASKFFPRISMLRELCQSDATVAQVTDVPSWINHAEGKFFCATCDDSGFVRRLACDGDGRCHVGNCGKEGYSRAPHLYTRACSCRGSNPILIRQRELSRQMHPVVAKE